MTAKAFANGVADLLANDAVLQSELTQLLGVPVRTILRSNQPLSQIAANFLPAIVIEQGDGEAQSIDEGVDSFITIGNTEQQFASELHVALVWNENDRERAADQRGTLPELVCRLFLRNPAPSGIVSAYLERWQPDRAANHPNHIWQATIRGLYSVAKS